MATIRDQLRAALRNDGVDHIHLSHFGETNMGKLAAPESRRRFYIPHLGEFQSPRCFANWMCSKGDETLRYSTGRYNTPNTPIYVFRFYFLYAKYFQLLSVRETLVEEKDQLSLPWVMYKKHVTGIKEFDRWEDFPVVVKAMVSHLINRRAKEKPDWETLVPGMLAAVNQRVREIAEINGENPDTVVDLLNADNVARERKKAAISGRETRKNPEAPAMAPAALNADGTQVEQASASATSDEIQEQQPLAEVQAV